MHWPVVLCLFTAWIVTWICFIKGIKTSGKAVYVTSVMPYVVLTIFLIRGLTLNGAMTGLKFLFTPDVNELMNPQTWLDAGAQVFYSFGLAMGSLISFSSYNSVHNNCMKDALILSAVSGFTSIFSATVIYTIVGFRATNKYDNCISENIIKLLNGFDLPEESITTSNYEMALKHLNISYPDNVHGLGIETCDLEELLKSGVEGPGLGFIVFTEAITLMPASPVWSVLFFIMLLCLGISSQFGNMEGVMVPFRDLQLYPQKWPQEGLTGTICVVCFIISLVFAQQSGIYWLTVFDSFAGSVPLLVVGFFEMIAVVYIYGIDRFNEDFKFMIGYKPGFFWQATWRVISPLITLIILMFYVVNQFQEELTYSVWDPQSEDFPSLSSVPYPSWISAVLVVLTGVPSLLMPVYALCRLLYVYCKKKKHLPDKM